MNNQFLFVIVLLVLLSSCQRELQFEGGTWDFDSCISVTNFTLYEDYLILIHQGTQGTKFTVINYLTNEFDVDLQNALNKTGISQHRVKNDSLYVYSELDKTWLRWDKKWKSTSFQDTSHIEFDKTKLAKECHHIFEDVKYCIYAYHQGEFGSGVIFRNKTNGQLYGHPFPPLISVLKDSDSYVIAGYGYADWMRTKVARIKNPDLLPIVNDSVINEYIDYDLQRRGSLQTFPDSVWIKLQCINDEIDKFYGSEQPYDVLVRLQKQFDSICRHYDNNTTYLLDNSQWYTHDKTLCFASFIHKNQLLHLLKSEDGCLYIAQLADGKVKAVRDTITCQLTSQSVAFSRQIFDKSLILVDYDWYRNECKRITVFIIDNEHIKRYNFGF